MVGPQVEEDHQVLVDGSVRKRVRVDLTCHVTFDADIALGEVSSLFFFSDRFLSATLTLKSTTGFVLWRRSRVGRRWEKSDPDRTVWVYEIPSTHLEVERVGQGLGLGNLTNLSKGMHSVGSAGASRPLIRPFKNRIVRYLGIVPISRFPQRKKKVKKKDKEWHQDEEDPSNDESNRIMDEGFSFYLSGGADADAARQRHLRGGTGGRPRRAGPLEPHRAHRRRLAAVRHAARPLRLAHLPARRAVKNGSLTPFNACPSNGDTFRQTPPPFPCRLTQTQKKTKKRRQAKTHPGANKDDDERLMVVVAVSGGRRDGPALRETRILRPLYRADMVGVVVFFTT